MKTARRQGGWLIAASLIVSLMLMMAPLPEWARILRPEWTVLVVLYWCLALPHRVGVGIAWIMGLLLDTLKGALLGQHALALAIVAYITINLHQRMRLFPAWQQAFTVLIILSLYQLLILWFDGIAGRRPAGWTPWLSPVMGMLFWPWIFILLRALRRQFKVQ